MCINLHLRRMMDITRCHKVYWCHIVLKCLHEEAAKPETTRKSDGLMLNFILTNNVIKKSSYENKILAGKFLGGTKPMLYNKSIAIEHRPDPYSIPY